MFLLHGQTFFWIGFAAACFLQAFVSRCWHLRLLRFERRRTFFPHTCWPQIMLRALLPAGGANKQTFTPEASVHVRDQEAAVTTSGHRLLWHKSKYTVCEYFTVSACVLLAKHVKLTILHQR